MDTIVVAATAGVLAAAAAWCEHRLHAPRWMPGSITAIASCCNVKSGSPHATRSSPRRKCDRVARAFAFRSFLLWSGCLDRCWLAG